MSKELQTLISYNKNLCQNYNLKLNYSKVEEKANENILNNTILEQKSKIKQSQYSSTLQINLSKNGILCQDNCSVLIQTITSIFNQNDKCNLELEIDLKKMIDAGGIHYYLQKQLETLNSHLQILSFTLKLTNELFNTQCLGVISNSLKQFINIQSFSLISEIKLDQLTIFSSISPNLTNLQVKLIDPKPDLFPQLLAMKNLSQLQLYFDECNTEIQFEIQKYFNSTKIIQLSFGIRFQSFLMKKDEFYNSLSNSIKILNNKKIQLEQYQLDLSQVEDSGLKQDILTELSKGVTITSLKKLNLIFYFEAHIQTLVLSLLFKLSDLLFKLINLDSLKIQMNIPQKCFDILQNSLNKNLWKLKEFIFINTSQKMVVFDVNIQNENECKLTNAQGITIKNNLSSLKNLIRYNPNFMNDSMKRGIKQQNESKSKSKDKYTITQQQYLFQKRKLIYLIYGIQITSLFKRKEIKEQLLNLFLI